MDEKQCFRYWIEIRELTSGSVRTLSLNAVVKISLSRQKKNEAPIPREELLLLKDGDKELEVKSFDELRAQLREKYPDNVFERTLHIERDRAAEERRERGLNELVRLLAEQAVDEMMK